MRMPKWVRWSHRQMVLLLLDSLDTLQPSLFQPPAPPGGSTEALLHITITSVPEHSELLRTFNSPETSESKCWLGWIWLEKCKSTHQYELLFFSTCFLLQNASSCLFFTGWKHSTAFYVSSFFTLKISCGIFWAAVCRDIWGQILTDRKTNLCLHWDLTENSLFFSEMLRFTFDPPLSFCSTWAACSTFHSAAVNWTWNYSVFYGNINK